MSRTHLLAPAGILQTWKHVSEQCWLLSLYPLSSPQFLVGLQMLEDKPRETSRSDACLWTWAEPGWDRLAFALTGYTAKSSTELAHLCEMSQIAPELCSNFNPLHS